GTASAPALSIPEAKKPSVVSIVYRDGGGDLHLDWPIARLEEALADSRGLLWVDFQGEDEGAIREIQHWLQDVFHFHPLSGEDALEESHIPKIDDWESYLYLVFQVPCIDQETDLLLLHELDAFLGVHYLVTYHATPLDIFERERANIQRDPRDRLRHGADH